MSVSSRENVVIYIHVPFSPLSYPNIATLFDVRALDSDSDALSVVPYFQVLDVSIVALYDRNRIPVVKVCDSTFVTMIHKDNHPR